MSHSATAYKLVDRVGYTRRGQTGATLWLPVGKIGSPTGEGSEPCGPGVLHAYASPEVAALGNPVHAVIRDPRCLRIEIIGHAGAWETDGLKRWTTSPVRVVEEVPMPALSLDEIVAWAIVLAPHPSTRAWAIRWLSGDDRTAEAAEAAAEAAWTAEAALAAEAAWAEARAARAAEAARAAAGAARAARAAEAHLMPALARARAILAGEWPAERYDDRIDS